MTPRLTVFLDVVSPFAYMAWYMTKNSQTFKNVEVTYIPIFLGGVMQACGNKAPIEIKNKAKWINLERQRWAEQFKIPILEGSPEPFPQLTVNPMRALCLVQKQHPAALSDCFGAMWQAFWVEGREIRKPEVWTAALQQVLGEEKGKKIAEACGGAEAKKLLKENTDYALSEDAFGLPWFLATNEKGETEKYWGFDHLGQVIEHLGLKRTDGGFRAML